MQALSSEIHEGICMRMHLQNMLQVCIGHGNTYTSSLEHRVNKTLKLLT
jgi:hypothetical protein